jgi:hypothetical protein
MASSKLGSMKFSLIAAIAMFAMTSCVAVVQPSPAPRPTTVNVAPVAGVTIDRRLKIPAYPNSQILDIDADDNDTKVTFTSRDRLEQVNAYFHREIVARGYTRIKYEIKNSATKIEAEYRKDRQKLEYKLDKQGNSGRFTLELEFDD